MQHVPFLICILLDYSLGLQQVVRDPRGSSELLQGGCHNFFVLSQIEVSSLTYQCSSEMLLCCGETPDGFVNELFFG